MRTAPTGCLSLLMFGLVLALPFVLANAVLTALTKLGLGPLIGADLLHLDDIAQLGAEMASIGGAGTFDGVVLSGLVATLLVPGAL